MSARGLDDETYREHAPRLMALAASLVGPSHAEDVVAGAVLGVMSAGVWSTVENPAAYLTRAVVNEARSFSRSTLRRTAREARYAARPGTDPIAGGDPQLLAVLLRLPLRQRAVTFLTYWADLAPQTVAELLGISEGSVRRHLARARATLRKELA